MHLKLCIIFNSLLILLTTVSVVENGSSTAPKNPATDDFYTDDTEGSGAGAGSNTDGKFDLESAGSGFGPDDEDADRESGTFIAPKKPDVINTKRVKTLVDPEVDEEDEDDEEEEEDDGEDSPHLPPPTTKVTPLTPPPVMKTPDDYPKTFEKETGETNPPTTTSIVYTSTISTTTMDSIPVIDDVPRNGNGNGGVYIHHDKDRTISFFAQPGILAAVIGGAVVGLLCAILVVMFIVYRMRKKDEGSYVLEEMKRSPASNPYMKANHREFYA